MRHPFLAPLVGLLLLASRPGATWSIVCVDLETHEVAVSSCTCLSNFNLLKGVPVVVVGEGAAAAQSSLDSFGDNRRIIFDEFRDTEHTPAQILAHLASHDPQHQTRQYGIVNFTGDPVTFTGARDGQAATGVSGRVGNVVYAIQGNILTGNEVVLAAEAAFRAATGDLGQRIMAGMEAARALGGDGRCSCTTGSATSCGVPPPNFTKSAHVGFIVVARVGDRDGACSSIQGCAGGPYYLSLNVRDDVDGVDPVIQLQGLYLEWRKHRLDRPDAIRSRVTARPLPANGTTEREVVIELRDIEGKPLSRGGAQVEVTPLEGTPLLSKIGPVQDLGGGFYAFAVQAGTRSGTDHLVIRVTDALPGDPSDVVTTTLFPYLDLRSVGRGLEASPSALSASEGGRLSFTLSLAEKAGAPYRLVARLADAGPFQRRALARPRAVLPIAQSPFFPAAPGLLDSDGFGDVELVVPARALEPLIGRRLEVTGSVLDGPPLESTRAVAVELVP